MPSLLVNKSIMLVARARLVELRDALEAKMRLPIALNTDLEHRLLFLASNALTMLSSGAIASLDPPRPLTERISRFAVLGSAGPTFLAASAAFGSGRDWPYLTLRKGTPDANREKVVALSTDFAFKLWERLSATAANDASALTNYRAYLLGYLCHVAGAVVCGPFVDDFEWQRGPGRDAGPSLTPGTGGLLDARAAIQVLARDNPREGEAWTTYWPAPGEVPPAFWDAFNEAFRLVHGEQPVAGSREFEQSVTSPRAELTPAFVRDAYGFYYHGVVGVEYTYGYWNWLGFFLPLAITFGLTLGIAPAIPRLRRMFTVGPWNLTPEAGSSDSVDATRSLAWLDIFAYPLLMSGPAALVYGIQGHCFTNRGALALNVSGIVSGGLITALLVIYLATLGVDEDDFQAGWRWFLFVVLPVIAPIVFLIIGILHRKNGLGVLGALYSLPLFMLLIGFVLYFVFLGLGLAGEEIGFEEGGLIAEYVVLAILFSAALIVAWAYISKCLRDGMLPEMADDRFMQRRREVVVSRLPTDRPGFVRLFDETTLFQDGAQPPAAVVRAQQYFPSGRRKLIKLWWTARAGNVGTLHVRSDRYSLVFAAAADGTGPRNVIPVPIGPATGADMVAALHNRDIDVGTVRARLHAALIFPPSPPAAAGQGDLDYELPPGATFSDHGDAETSTAGHDRLAAGFRAVGTDPNAADVYTLFHAPKVMQSVRFGRGGAANTERREGEIVRGGGSVRSEGTTVFGTDTAFHEFLRVGDFVAVGSDIREVALVRNNGELVLSSAFTPDAPAGSDYFRVGREVSAGEGSVQTTGTTVRGTDTIFVQLFVVGDFIAIGGVVREVTRILNQTELEVASAFDSDHATGVPYFRVGGSRERLQGFSFVGTSAGGSPDALMDLAADLGALLCMAGVGRILEGQTIPGMPQNPNGARVGAVRQVFRNWNLDRRRVNEWRVLIGGGALAENPNDFGAYGANPPADSNPAQYPAWRREGAEIAHRMGWVPLLRQFLADVRANRDFSDAAGARGVGRALAHLLDLPEPQFVVTPP